MNFKDFTQMLKKVESTIEDSNNLIIEYDKEVGDYQERVALLREALVTLSKGNRSPGVLSIARKALERDNQMEPSLKLRYRK